MSSLSVNSNCLFLGRFVFLWREIQLQDGVGGANRYALAAKPAFIVNDISQIIGDGDGLERTSLLAFATSDTCYITRLACYAPFLLIHATDINPS